MRTFSVNKGGGGKELVAPLVETSEDRGGAAKWFAAAIVAILVVLTITILALVIPEQFMLPSCRYYESQGTVVIRDVQRLTPEAKMNLTIAYKKMKTIYSVYDPTVFAWDYFVGIHLLAVKYNITTDWRFLPWAREFGIRFRKEVARAMGTQSSKVVFGYWNWTDPASTSVLYAADFLGGTSDPSDGCLVQDGNFTNSSNWTIYFFSIEGERKGLLRCQGNGLQICQSSLSKRHFLLETPNNPRSVDTQPTVGPFLDIEKNDSRLDDLIPNASNLEQKWDDPGADRYYHGNESEVLKCRHYGSRPLANNETQLCKSMSTFASTSLDSLTFASCLIGLQPEDTMARVAETRGVPLHSLYGALRAYLGGSLSGVTPPNDPVFPHLLANLDRLWVEFQQEHPRQTDTFIESLDLLDEDIPGFVGTSYRSMLDTRQRHYTYDTMCTEQT